MRKFALGMMAGLVLGSSLTAIAAVVAGEDGFLHGWPVTKDGEEDWIWKATKEIE